MRTSFVLLALGSCLAQLCMAQVDSRWKPNDPERPLPPVIEAGTASNQDAPGRPPSDAVVLFDGKDLSLWVGEDGQPAKWKEADVYGQFPPQVNASRPPGQWQTYDIIFHSPRFDKDGKVLHQARVTVLHNG